MNSILSPSLLCREMLRLTRACLGGAPIEFVPTPHNVWFGAFRDCTQRHIDFLIEPRDLVQGFDDFAERMLMPCATKLSEHLKNDGIQYCYELAMPSEGPAARYQCDGMSMRLIIEPRVYQGKTKALRDELPDSYFIRFDVLFSHHPVDLTRSAA